METITHGRSSNKNTPRHGISPKNNSSDDLLWKKVCNKIYQDPNNQVNDQLSIEINLERIVQ